MAKKTADHAISVGLLLARKVFAKRGNHSEAHLTETELAALMALAIQEAAKDQSLMYVMKADDVSVWMGLRRPTQAEVDRAATDANRRGWNGCELDLYLAGHRLDSVTPSEEVLA